MKTKFEDNVKVVVYITFKFLHIYILLKFGVENRLSVPLYQRSQIPQIT